MAHTLIASDLHLSAARPAIVESFFAFLGGAARQADALYILGDLFDLWVGDDDPDPLNGAVLDGLAGLAGAGVRVFLMHGNRDFVVHEGDQIEVAVSLGDHRRVVQFEGDPDLIDAELVGVKHGGRCARFNAAHNLPAEAGAAGSSESC